MTSHFKSHCGYCRHRPNLPKREITVCWVSWRLNHGPGSRTSAGGRCSTAGSTSDRAAANPPAVPHPPGHLGSVPPAARTQLRRKEGLRGGNKQTKKETEPLVLGARKCRAPVPSVVQLPRRSGGGEVASRSRSRRSSCNFSRLPSPASRQQPRLGALTAQLRVRVM